ncbi:MAG: hypothetical protein R3F14_16350 [Polyangiaceae bacterium]
MKRARVASTVAALVTTACILLSGGDLSAAPSRKDVQAADKLFREARALMAKGEYEPACPKLEESQGLDPAPGTQYQLAVCYEHTGRPATAVTLYLEVAELAKQAGYKDKEKVARENADALSPKVPRLVIEVADALRGPGLAITRDGAPVPESDYNAPILVNPGEVTIEATAPGKPFKSTVASRARVPR